MRIAVVGAGIGGLTLALALQAKGLRPLLLERGERLEPVGAGVQLGPNAVRILFALGLEDALRAVAVEPQAAEVRGGVHDDVRLRMILGAGGFARRRWGAPYLQVHRADLQAILLDAVRARDAAQLRLGAAVRAAPGGGLVVDGAPLEAEVVVGADGVRSVVRQAGLGGPPPRPLHEIAWRALVPAAGGPAVTRVWVFPRMHVVAYPVSAGRRLNLVAVTPGDLPGGSWSEPGEVSALRQALGRAAPQLRALLAQASETTRWALHDLAPLERWTDGRIVLLGDAAHAMAPYLAQGAALAVEDAEALARRLASGDAPAAALAAYEAERRPRAQAVQAASRRNGRLFHLPGPVSRAGFAAAALVDGLRGGPQARLDWLYGYRPPTA